MDRTYTLAVVLGVLCIAGCASTQTARVQSQEEKVAEFRKDVRDYERLQRDQGAQELASEADKLSTESIGEPGQVENVFLPK